MFKYSLNFLFIFLLLSTFSFAKNDDSKLQSEYGADLTQAPFFLRFSFSKKFDKDWSESTYAEREAFLKGYEKDLAAEQAQEKAEAKAQADAQKEALLEEKEELRKEKERLKAEQDEEKAEQKAEKERQKEFDEAVTNQEATIQQMQYQARQPNTADN